MADSFSLNPEETAIIGSLSNWVIWKLGSDKIAKLDHIERRKDLVAIYASGDATHLKDFNGTKARAAMDVIVRESNRRPGEPECNIYHSTFEPDGKGNLSQIGPFKDQTILPHWPHGKTTKEVVSHYEKQAKGEI